MTVGGEGGDLFLHNGAGHSFLHASRFDYWTQQYVIHPLFFPIPFIILALLFAFISLVLHSRSNSDLGSRIAGGLLPPPHYSSTCLHFFREKSSAFNIFPPSLRLASNSIYPRCYLGALTDSSK